MIEEEPESITEKSLDLGLGTPESPLGSSAAQATPQQAAMVGTPAQRDSAQEKRTLAERKRYEGIVEKDITSAQEKAQSLKTLGPVRSRVESLIQQRLEETKQRTVELQINQDKINTLPANLREGAQSALNVYLANPSEENLQSFYDTVGRAQLEAGGIESFVTGAAEAIGGIAQEELAGTVTLEQLDLSKLGVSEQELEQTLGPEYRTMTLDQLDQKIDEIEAKEFSRVEAIRASLEDPRLPPTTRKQLLRELAGLSTAGMVGLEEDIDRLDQQIEAADTVTIGNREMSLEEALGDDGISALIANAVSDPAYLEDLKRLPGYKGLGAWVEDNKKALETLVGEVDTDIEDFFGVQDKFSDIKKSLGAGGEKVLESLFEDLDLNISSISSKELAALQKDLDNSAVFNFLKGNIKEQQKAKESPEFLAQLKLMEANDLGSDDIEEIFDFIEMHQEDGIIKELLGDLSVPSSAEEFIKLRDSVDRINDIDENFLTPDVVALIKGGTIDLEDIEDLEGALNPEEILDDIVQLHSAKSKWNKFISTNEKLGKDLPAEVRASLFGADVSRTDLEHAMNTSDDKTRNLIADFFDTNSDGKISRSEFEDPAIVKRVADRMGLNLSTDDIVAQEGTWDVDAVKKALAGKVSPDQFANALRVEIDKAYSTRVKQLSEDKDDLTKAKDELLAEANIEDIPNFESALKVFPQFKEALTKSKSAKDELDAAQKALESYGKPKAKIGKKYKVESDDWVFGTFYDKEHAELSLDLEKKRAAYEKSLEPLKEVKDKPYYSTLISLSPTMVKKYKKFEDSIKTKQNYIDWYSEKQATGTEGMSEKQLVEEKKKMQSITGGA